MKKVLPRTLGYFLFTLLPVVYLHLVELPTWGQLVDGILSSVAFTMPFMLALWLARRLSLKYKIGGFLTELIIGAVAGAFMWSLLWVSWNVVPEKMLVSAENWAFYSHLIAAFGTACLSTCFGIGKQERAGSSTPSPSY
ncbi:MAG: hypothetical protein KTR30_19170 [Saprospiraceae bacterium]|nr:hypothetical protein [Saprospiraceae bacterium]